MPMVTDGKPIWAVAGSESVIYGGGAGGKLLTLDISSLKYTASILLSDGWINGIALSECSSLLAVATSRGELLAIDTSRGVVVTK